MALMLIFYSIVVAVIGAGVVLLAVSAIYRAASTLAARESALARRHAVEERFDFLALGVGVVGPLVVGFLILMLWTSVYPYR